MLNVLIAPQKNRKGVGASFSFLMRYLHPYKLISDRYPNKGKRDALDGLIITRREVIRVTRREHLYILMIHKDFRDHELNCVHRWVRIITEDIETPVFKDNE